MLDLEDLRQQYDRLTDHALLEVAREDLVDLARDICDAELTRRGLARPVAEPSPTPDSEPEPEETAGLVVLAEFASFVEASLIQSALTSAGISSSIKETGPYRTIAGPTKILVSRESLEEARAVLDTPISDDDLAAQAEAAGPPEE